MLECSLALHDAMRNRRASAERRALRATTGDRLIGQPQTFPLLTCAWYALSPCDHPRLLSSIETVLEHSRNAGSLRGIAPAFTYRSMVMLARGDLDEAVHDGRLAVEAGKNSGLDLGPLFVGNSLISALLARGGLEEAQCARSPERGAGAREPLRSPATPAGRVRRSWRAPERAGQRARYVIIAGWSTWTAPL
ncbi:hypothetical protein [Streptosporangium sp. NPDC049644]|uniref:hypothetical protein n=1 Tax=Streptosporangium sp. NPDC049644 TaxID=3155507 RepID=UPI0034307E97